MSRTNSTKALVDKNLQESSDTMGKF